MNLIEKLREKQKQQIKFHNPHQGLNNKPFVCNVEEPFVLLTDIEQVLSERNCSRCKFEEFSDKAGSLCKKHNQWLNEMFPDDEITLNELGCNQWQSKEE